MAENTTRKKLNEINDEFNDKYYNSALKKYGRTVSLVLPQSYDDSLTFYEALNKLMYTLNGEITRAQTSENVIADDQDKLQASVDAIAYAQIATDLVKGITVTNENGVYTISFTTVDGETHEAGTIEVPQNNPVVEIKDTVVEDNTNKFDFHTFTETTEDGTENNIGHFYLAQNQITGINKTSDFSLELNKVNQGGARNTTQIELPGANALTQLSISKTDEDNAITYKTASGTTMNAGTIQAANSVDISQYVTPDDAYEATVQAYRVGKIACLNFSIKNKSGEPITFSKKAYTKLFTLSNLARTTNNFFYGAINAGNTLGWLYSTRTTIVGVFDEDASATTMYGSIAYVAE